MNTINCKVVMLPDTSDRSQPGAYPCIVKRLMMVGQKVVEPSDATLIYLPERNVEKMPYKAQHLYFTSNEEIKEGDWCVGKDIAETFKEAPIIRFHQWKKIVASTDPSLGLPTIPESFLTQYAKSNGEITDVKLEMQEKWAQRHSIGKWDDCEFTLKITTNNEIVVAHWTEDGKVWDMIYLGSPQACVLGENKNDKQSDTVMNTINCMVVMLPQKLQANFKQGHIIKYTIDGRLAIMQNTIPAYQSSKPTSREMCNTQHLYFASNEEIKEGDWFMRDNNSISKCEVGAIGLKRQFPFYHKIVASTNPSLGLPIIPESFMVEYVESNGKITDVKLEMYHRGPTEYAELKITNNNEVVVVDSVINAMNTWFDIMQPTIENKFGKKDTEPGQLFAEWLDNLRDTNDALWKDMSIWGTEGAMTRLYQMYQAIKK